MSNYAEETVSAIDDSELSMREIARRAQVAAGSVSDLVRGKPVSLQTLNAIRLSLGMPAIGTKEVAVCPDCGDVHLAECGGRSVAAILALSDEEFAMYEKARNIHKRSTGPRNARVSRGVSLLPHEAEELDDLVAKAGYASVAKLLRDVQKRLRAGDRIWYS